MKSITGVFNKCAMLTPLLFLLFTGFGNIQAQDVTLSFPVEVTGEQGDQFSVDVNASDLTDLSIFNFDVAFSFDSSFLELTSDGIQEGDLLDGPLTVNVTSDDRILVSYASSQALAEAGTLFTISGTLVGEEENPEGLKVTDLLIGDGSLNVSPTVPVDITVEIVDPVGKVNLDFSDPINGKVGELFSRDITASDLSDLGVSNFDMEMSFDSSLLTITDEDIQNGDLLGGPLTVNVTDDDRILVSYASSRALEGAGTLLTISGTLAGAGENPEGLKVTDLLIGDGSLNVTPTLPVDIAVDVTPEPIEWELSTKLINMSGPDADTAEFGITQTGGTADLTWELSNNVDWLSFSDGTTGTGSASVAIAIEENTQSASREGVITITTNAGTGQVMISQPGAENTGEISLDFGGPVSGQTGESFTVEVKTSDLTDLGVSNFDVEFSYDTSLLEIDVAGIEAGRLLDGPVTANVTDDGRILVSYASSQDLEGSGTLFTVSGMLAGEGENQQGLRVVDVLIGDGSLEVTPTLPVDIAVDVIVNIPPSVNIDNGPPSGGTIDFDDPGFVWSGSDSDGTVDGYEVELIGPSSNGFSTTETSFQFENLANGNYTFRVRAIDNNKEYSDWSERSFTVNVIEVFPDLLVEDVNGPDKAKPNSEIDVTFRILNNGQVEASAGWTGRIYLSNDSSITDEDTEIGSWQQNDIIASGGEQFDTKQGVIPESYSFGEYYLGVIVDVESEITEEADENNVAVSSSIIEIGEITSNTKDGRVLTFNLEQNFPNPFNPTTQIEYALPEMTHVMVEVYNMLGQRVALLVNEMKSAGLYQVNFDASDLSSGVYLYRLRTDTYVETKQMMLIK